MDSDPRAESLPQTIRAEFAAEPGNTPRVRVRACLDDGSWVSFGDVLDDNSNREDGYRFHDVLHLAHFAFLGWSPTIRALLQRKRKSQPDVDRVEDGARAIAIEEAICALVYGLRDATGPAREAGATAIRHLTQGLEVGHVSVADWEVAHRRALDVMTELARGDTSWVLADRNARRLVAS